MKKRNKIIIISSSIVLLVALLVIGISYWLDWYKDKHRLDDLTSDNLLYLELESNYIDEREESIKIKMNFENRTITSGTQKQFIANEQKETVLNEEQCQELKDYIVEYSHKVKAKEKEYWPQTDEYPDMYRLFDYKIEFEDGEVYRTSGALCYPDDWEMFIEKLMGY